MKNKSIKKYLIRKSSTVKNAMRIIEDGQDRIGFLVDKNENLMKAISDGDVRRFLLDGNSIDSAINEIHDREPIILKEGYSNKDLRIAFENSVNVVPVISKDKKIVDLIKREELSNLYNVRSKQIGIVGLGYVGLTLGLVLADKGFNVIGYDISSKLIKKLRKKEPPFFENGIDVYLKNHIGKKLRITDKANSLDADIYIVSVGTPIDKKTLLPDKRALISSIELLANKLKINDLIIMRSTLPIKSTRNLIVPKIETLSGLNCGKDFFISVCPERTIEGNALNELTMLPQIVGGFNYKSSELSISFFNEISHTVVDVGSLEAAEISKLIDNSYRDYRFAFSNSMSMLSEELNLDYNDIVQKVNLGYERNDIPLPSPGVGGPCLSKDPYILSNAFTENGLDSKFLLNARTINESAPKNITNRLINFLLDNKKDIINCKICIIGFAFKGNPETSDLRDSTTLWLLEELKKNGFVNIYGFDPVVNKEELEEIGVKPTSIEDGFQNADIVLIMNNHISYNKLNILKLLKTMNKPALFYDSWSMFSGILHNNLPNKIVYAGVGR
tara:strand:- start:23031 stop:24707 length:1677 start_codon:yes stop_codon:yes gene_type:complete